MGWATTGHTPAPVPITSTGPGAERLAGSIENTDVFRALAKAMDLTSTASTSDRTRSTG
jgi:alkaline phosphatase